MKALYPLTQDQFEQEARQVLAACGLDAKTPLKLSHHIQNVLPTRQHTPCEPGDRFHADLETKLFRLYVDRFVNPTQSVLDIGMRFYVARKPFPGETLASRMAIPDAGWLNFTQHFSAQGIIYSSRRDDCDDEYVWMLLGAHARLGYDVAPFLEQLELTLTAHERLEWELIRREANQLAKNPTTNNSPK